VTVAEIEGSNNSTTAWSLIPFDIIHIHIFSTLCMYCTAPLSPRKGRLRGFRGDDDDDDDDDDMLST